MLCCHWDGPRGVCPYTPIACVPQKPERCRELLSLLLALCKWSHVRCMFILLQLALFLSINTALLSALVLLSSCCVTHHQEGGGLKRPRPSAGRCGSEGRAPPRGAKGLRRILLHAQAPGKPASTDPVTRTSPAGRRRPQPAVPGRPHGTPHGAPTGGRREDTRDEGARTHSFSRPVLLR